jgi:hypothetical protein
LATAIGLTDILVLFYRAMSGLAAAGLIVLPSTFMYADYAKPWVCAWNWSILPFDAGFSITGFAAIVAARRGLALWRPLALISLTLTVTAGLMADSYWTLMGQFDPSWFLPNLALVIWPLPYIAWLMAANQPVWVMKRR